MELTMTPSADTSAIFIEVAPISMASTLAGAATSLTFLWYPRSLRGLGSGWLRLPHRRIGIDEVDIAFIRVQINN